MIMVKTFGNIEKRLISNAWRGAAVALWISTAVMMWMGIYDLFRGEGLYPFGISVAFLGSIGLVLAALAVLAFLKLLRFVPFYYYAPLAVCLFLIFFESPLETFAGMLAFALVAILLPSLFGACAGWQATGNLRLVRLVCVSLSGIAVVYVIYFTLSDGTADPYLPRPRESVAVTPLLVPNPSLKGPYSIKSLYYGSGSDRHRSEFNKKAELLTAPVDGSHFIKGWSGLIGWIRSSFWGFDATDLPLNGRVWFPEGTGPFPLVLILHGNHTMHDFSDNGYDYLAKLFAGHGYIAASVDENFLNTFWFDAWSDYVEQPARGWLVLQHLKQWKEWNATEDIIFFGKVDMDKIALIGHSRGGEAIVTAAALNELSRFPDSAEVLLNDHFNIRGLAAISPVDGQYKPAGLDTPIRNVDYFSMHGSHDGDVRSFAGSLAYRRVTFKDERYHFKSLLYIVGANHGQFNTSWGRDDEDFPQDLFLNTKQLMTAEEQKKIAEVFLTAFLEVCLKENYSYLPLFRDERVGKQWLPETQYFSQFQDSKTAFAFADKKDLDITKLTIPGGKIEAKNLTEWKLERPTLRLQDHLQTALFVEWDQSSSLTLTFPSDYFKHRPESVLTFSAADARDDDTSSDAVNLEDEPIDFTLTVTDEEGNEASLPLSHDRHLMPQVRTEIWKATFMDGQANVEPVYQTFQFPLADFAKVNPAFDLMKLKSLTFNFDLTPEGEIYLDRIGFL